MLGRIMPYVIVLLAVTAIFRNSGGRVVIRYDPAVLGTPGMKAPAGAAIVGWVAAWEELP